MEIKDIEDLANLARIELSEQEKKDLLKDTEEILRFVDQVQEVKTPDSAEERVGVLRNIMREDGEPHETGLHTGNLMEESPSREGDYIKVKKIL